ncbi:MAG: potassium channel family protein [Omnitrophica WOR_2 bacterium]
MKTNDDRPAASKNRFFWRKLRASWRDTWLLFREFGWPLLAFSIAIIGGGFLYDRLSVLAGEPTGGPLEGMYQVLTLTFLQPIHDFPKEWYLDIFYFLMPVIGIGILAQGVADFGILLFNRRARGKEWEMAVASTYNNHIVLIGLGHLGYRVARNLYQMEQDVVVIELNPSADLVANVKQMDIPVLVDDSTRESTLLAAGVKRARSIVLCTQNDSLNLQVALKARSLNPKINVIVRIFEESFAQALQEQFGFKAMSATGMAAPAFAAAAAGLEMTPPLTIEGEAMSLARLNIMPSSQLAGRAIGEVETKYEISIVMLRRNGAADLHPAATRSLEVGDVLAVLGGPNELSAFMQANIGLA